MSEVGLQAETNVGGDTIQIQRCRYIVLPETEKTKPTSSNLSTVQQGIREKHRAPCDRTNLSHYASLSLFFLSSSNNAFTPSTSPIAAWPEFQSTTIGHFSAFGFWDASSATPSALVGRLSTVGCAEISTSGEGVRVAPPDFAGR